MPIAFSTGEMITELEHLRAEVHNLLESLGESFTIGRLEARFAFQLEEYGVSKTEADSLAEGLISWVTSTREHLEVAASTAGSALHVLARAQTKARNNVPMV